MLLYVKIIRYCIKYYNIFSFEEIKELLKIKSFNYDNKLSVKKIIIYSDNNIIKCDQILKIIDGKLVLTSTIIDIPHNFICLRLTLKYKLYEIIIYYLLLLLMIVFAFLNIKVSLMFFTVACFIKHNNVIILSMCINIIVLNILIYENYFALISLLCIILTYINNKFIYFSFVPLLFLNKSFAINLFIIYILLIVLYKLYNDYKLNYFEKLFFKMMVKHPISKVESITVNNKSITKYGIYFFEVNKSSTIIINGINLKFVALENLYKEVELVYVKNINSFFTNRQKYSKIDNVSKFYIYLKNIE